MIKDAMDFWQRCRRQILANSDIFGAPARVGTIDHPPAADFDRPDETGNIAPPRRRAQQPILITGNK